jgi:hypothetical protein
VAKLHQLRQGVAGIVPDIVLLPSRAGGGASSSGRGARRLASMALAASLALAVFAGASFWAGIGPFERSGGPLISAVIAEHDRWLSTGRGELLPADLPASAGARLLAASGLVQVHHDTALRLDGVTITHSGFVGAHGCRLSLFEVPVDAGEGLLIDALTASGDGVRAEEWANRTGRFVVVARDMDPTRFSVVVDALKRSTGEGGVDETVVAGLESARQPCLS